MNHWQTQYTVSKTGVAEAYNKFNERKKSLKIKDIMKTMDNRIAIDAEALEHFVMAAHPHQAVDGDVLFTPAEGRVPETYGSALGMPERRFETEAHGRIRGWDASVNVAAFGEGG